MSSLVGSQRVRPLGLVPSLAYFGIPAAALAAALGWLRPYLTQSGFSKGGAYLACTILVMGGLLAASFVAYVIEGNPLRWKAMAERLRLGRISRRTLLLTLAGLVAYVGLSLAGNQLLTAVYRAVGFTAPDLTTGIVNPLAALVMVLFNILGEEIWWRGIILPRQELAMGRWVWVAHGVLWALFHIFKWWAVPVMMVVCLVVPFVAWKTKSTWPGILTHLVVNGAGVVMLMLQRV